MGEGVGSAVNLQRILKTNGKMINSIHTCLKSSQLCPGLRSFGSFSCFLREILENRALYALQLLSYLSEANCF